jgi:thermostable 8-oxoguanine DNA glycosylase
MPALAADSDNLQSFLERFNYQRELTSRLDAIGDDDITTSLLHEIVLWKVNRYPKIPEKLLSDFNGLKDTKAEEHRKAESVLLGLLRCAGVDLPMASTLLRFRNPNTFQIIDRHTYRALFGSDYPYYSSSSANDKVEGYFSYLDELHKLAKSKNVRFSDLDRILYVFDKELNGTL